MMMFISLLILIGGKMVEWSVPKYPSREELMDNLRRIENGLFLKPDSSDLGVHLMEQIENKFRCRDDAVCSCLTDTSIIPEDNIWKI